MTTIKIGIDGMSCQHCVMRVRKAIEALSGIEKLTVEVGQADITFDETKIQQKDIENTVVKAGYKLKN